MLIKMEQFGEIWVEPFILNYKSKPKNDPPPATKLKEGKRFKSIAIDLSCKIAVKIDRNTTVYVDSEDMVDRIRDKYSNRNKKLS